MRFTSMKLNDLLENLEEEDYNKAVSYIEFLISQKNRRIGYEKVVEKKTDIESIVASLTGAIPDAGKSLEEYRSERLKKYETSY